MNSNNQENDHIVRLRKLEKSQSRYRIAFLFTTAIAVGLCLLGAKHRTDDLLQAKSFEVVNDDGKVLARLSSVEGKGEMRLFKADGTPLVNVYSSVDNTGRVDLFNAGGKPMISMSSSSTGAGSIIVNNSSSNLSVQLASNSLNHGGIWVYNADGKKIAVITSSGTSADGMAETFDATGTRTGHLP
jgi:hypothetical protein